MRRRWGDPVARAPDKLSSCTPLARFRYATNELPTLAGDRLGAGGGGGGRGHRRPRAQSPISTSRCRRCGPRRPVRLVGAAARWHWGSSDHSADGGQSRRGQGRVGPSGTAFWVQSSLRELLVPRRTSCGAWPGQHRVPGLIGPTRARSPLPDRGDHYHGDGDGRTSGARPNRPYRCSPRATSLRPPSTDERRLAAVQAASSREGRREATVGQPAVAHSSPDSSGPGCVGRRPEWGRGELSRRTGTFRPSCWPKRPHWGHLSASDANVGPVPSVGALSGRDWTACLSSQTLRTLCTWRRARRDGLGCISESRTAAASRHRCPPGASVHKCSARLPSSCEARNGQYRAATAGTDVLGAAR